MSENYTEIGIKERLVEAGLKELLEHGPRDFSLRRVAAGAQVSCAAPYRHFKDKDDLVRAVIAQIRENWILLASEISKIFDKGSSAHIAELLTAGVRFWIAGENFAPFLSAGEIKEFDEPIIDATNLFAEAHNIDAAEAERIIYSLLALEYGTVTLIISKRASADEAISVMRKRIAELLV